MLQCLSDLWLRSYRQPQQFQSWLYLRDASQCRCGAKRGRRRGGRPLWQRPTWKVHPIHCHWRKLPGRGRCRRRCGHWGNCCRGLCALHAYRSSERSGTIKKCKGLRAVRRGDSCSRLRALHTCKESKSREVDAHQHPRRQALHTQRSAVQRMCALHSCKQEKAAFEAICHH